MPRRSATLVIVVLAGALALMKIPGIEKVGASLLASAGLAGIVVGLATRPAVANLLAGLQLALTQPIRIDDVVIVEGEWGRIEEVTNTFVVVRIWDLQRGSSTIVTVAAISCLLSSVQTTRCAASRRSAGLNTLPTGVVGNSSTMNTCQGRAGPSDTRSPTNWRISSAFIVAEGFSVTYSTGTSPA